MNVQLQGILPRDAYAYCGLYCRKLSVCPSVRQNASIVSKHLKHIIKLFSLSGSHTILIFPYKTLWKYSDRDPDNSRFSTNISLYLANDTR